MLGLAAWARRTGTRILGAVRHHRIIADGLDGMGWPPGPQAGGGQQQQQQQQGSGDPLLSAGSSGGHGGFQLSLGSMKALLTALPCWWEITMFFYVFTRIYRVCLSAALPRRGCSAQGPPLWIERKEQRHFQEDPAMH